MSDDMSSLSPSSAGEQGVLRSMQEVAMSSQEASKMLRTERSPHNFPKA